MKFINLHMLIGLCVLLFGCSDDFEKKIASEESPTEMILTLSVDDYYISSSGTRDSEPEIATDAEKKIENIWVFQYKQDGTKLADPIYIVKNQNDLAEIKDIPLVTSNSSTICVVANTNDAEWGKGSGFNTLEGLKNQALPNPEPIMESDLKTIPMFGTVTMKVTVVSRVTVHLTRMFAKVKISFGELATGLKPKSIEVSSIPQYCRVKSLSEDVEGEKAADYDQSTDWITRAFNADKSTGGQELEEYVIYVPEILQGETDSDTQENKSKTAPLNALVVNLIMQYYGTDNSYEEKDLKKTIYPGGNNYNNFNIKRNSVYRVIVNINDPESLHTPSANCFVVVPGRTLTFEPYYRTEIGGGYNFSDYLNPNVANKKIDHVGIIWQTFEAIGDNSDGTKVTFEENGMYSKIKVITNKEGNALIGAYNKDGEIVWSWHIWITGNDPGNVGNAVTYKTYEWDKNGIKSDKRVDGYAIMPCNLGALANSPEDTGNPNTPNNWYCKEKRTYGTLYQWGRKDPFPCTKSRTKVTGSNTDDSRFTYYDYNNYVVQVFDKSNNLITMSSNGYNNVSGELFQTVSQSSSTTIEYSIKHPTTHIAATTGALNEQIHNLTTSYKNGGNWLPVNDECLWGGIKINSSTEHYDAYPNEHRAIWRNYGTEKTIFDPCPKGWRVPPGDLWLGFTSDGLNKTIGTDGKDINIPSYCTQSIIERDYGFWICLTGWKTTDKKTHTFFPTPGSRLASGQLIRANVCGNYHNATVDPSDKTIQRVNILHFHSRGPSINTFETGACYYNKSVAGPIRCVRDTK